MILFGSKRDEENKDHFTSAGFLNFGEVSTAFSLTTKVIFNMSMNCESKGGGKSLYNNLITFIK